MRQAEIRMLCCLSFFKECLTIPACCFLPKLFPGNLDIFQISIIFPIISIQSLLKFKVSTMPMQMRKTSRDESKNPIRLHDEMREGIMPKANPAYVGKTSNMDSEYPEQSAASGRNFKRYRTEKKEINHGSSNFHRFRQLPMLLFSAFRQRFSGSFRSARQCRPGADAA